MADSPILNAVIDRLNQAETTIHRAVVALLKGQPVPDRPFAAVENAVRDHHGALWHRCTGRDTDTAARGIAALLNDAYRLGLASAEADRD